MTQLVRAAIDDRLIDLVSASAWTYLLVTGMVAADAVLPIVPGEAVVIAAVVLAVDGELSIVLVVVAAAVGGFAGDNASFAVGRGSVGRGARRMLSRGERGRQLVGWTERQLRERGRSVVVAARFIPGGRTATTFSCGSVDRPWRWFAGVDAVAVALWSLYSAGLGYLGGTTFQDSPWKGVLASLAAATVAALAAEGVRRARSGRG